MAIKYKPIPGFPGYLAGTDGSILTAWRIGPPSPGSQSRQHMGPEWRHMKPKLDSVGYLALQLHVQGKPGKPRHFRVHRLVLEAFVGPRPKGYVCCHADGTRTNNALSNLRWGTPANNSGDSRKHGTHLDGARHPNAKLTDEAVASMRARYAAGGIRMCDLAAEHGVSTTCARLAIIGKTWRSL
jgi:hypothetical protein